MAQTDTNINKKGASPSLHLSIIIYHRINLSNREPKHQERLRQHLEAMISTP